MGVKPLTIAVAAGVLLVAVIGADATMNRTYYVDVWNGNAWQPILEEPFLYEQGGRSYPYAPTIPANASDDIRFRLRIDNGYPWGASEPYTIHVGGAEVARGTLVLPARTEAVAEFAVKAETIMNGAPGLERPIPVKDASGLVSGGLEVRVDGKYLYPGITIKEVAK